MTRAYNMDCLEAMREMRDKQFDLALIDPPYGISVNMNMGRRKGMGTKHVNKQWDNSVPSDEFFEQLFRVSVNQIIWGGNYFNLPPTRGYIIWDKETPEDLSFSMCEFAWSSFDKVAKIFRRPIQTDNNHRIHPTQKPVALYRWLLHNYAHPGQTILDTHLGSGSSRIAADQLGFDFTGYELDKDYFEAQELRFKQYKSQLTLAL